MSSFQNYVLDYDDSEIPRWLSALLSEKSFFNACIIHEDKKKNDKNVFCLDCCQAICPHCYIHHRSHRLLQIRRYVYNDVVRLREMDRLIDCAQVQPYTTNGAKVVLLNQRPRPQAGPTKATGSLCITCDRNLQPSSLYCSLSCKVQYVLGTGCDLSECLRKCESPARSDSGLDDGKMTPDLVLEPAGSMRTESGSSSSGPAGLMDGLTLNCTATTEVVVRKKRSNLSVSRSPIRPACGPVSEISEGFINRRKGAPQRSPLY